MTTEEHQKRHKELHASLDELVADYLISHQGFVPSKATVLQLIKWSNLQATGPTHNKEGEQP